MCTRSSSWQGELVVVREPLVRFGAGDNCISCNPDKVATGHSIVFQRLQAEVQDAGNRRIIRASHCFVLAENHMRDGNSAKAVRQALEGILTSPSRWGIRLAITSCWQALREGISSVFAHRADAAHKP